MVSAAQTIAGLICPQIAGFQLSTEVSSSSEYSTVKYGGDYVNRVYSLEVPDLQTAHRADLSVAGSSAHSQLH